MASDRGPDAAADAATTPRRLAPPPPRQPRLPHLPRNVAEIHDEAVSSPRAFARSVLDPRVATAAAAAPAAATPSAKPAVARRSSEHAGVARAAAAATGKTIERGAHLIVGALAYFPDKAAHVINPQVRGARRARQHSRACCCGCAHVVCLARA
jgi:hypothetical protein